MPYVCDYILLPIVTYGLKSTVRPFLRVGKMTLLPWPTPLNEALTYLESIRHMGNIKTTDCHSLIRKFYMCSEETRAKLFISFCSNLYLSSLWSRYNVNTFNSLRNAYKNAFTILMKLPYGSDCSQKFVNLCVPNFSALIRRSNSSLLSRLTGSDNSIILKIMNSGVFYTSSILGKMRHNLYTT